MEHLPWDYGVEFHQEGQKIEMAFQPLTNIMASIQMFHDELGQMPSEKEGSKEPHHAFGPCPNTQVADFNFEKEVLGDIPLEKGHQAEFIDCIYSNQQIS